MASSKSVNQDVTTVAGKTYTLSFDRYFNIGAAGFIGVKIDQTSVYTIDASDKLGPGVWNANTVTFTANGATTNVRLEFLFGVQGTPSSLPPLSPTSPSLHLPRSQPPSSSSQFS